MIMELLAGIGLGIAITVILAVYILNRAEAALKKDVDTLVEAIKTEAAKTVISARVEQHSGVFYVYDTTNDHFLAQGNTIAELRETLEQRFSGKNIFVTEGDQDVIDRLRATTPPTNLETDHA